MLGAIHIQPLTLIGNFKRLTYVPHNDCGWKQVCSDIFKLPIVDPMGKYSHGYIGADSKKEDTY